MIFAENEKIALVLAAFADDEWIIDYKNDIIDISIFYFFKTSYSRKQNCFLNNKTVRLILRVKIKANARSTP